MSIKMSEMVTDSSSLLEEAKREVKKTPSTTKVKEEDHVTISNRSSQVQSFQQRILETPIVDKQKVEMIKNKLTNFELNINPMNIAEKILSLESEIFKKNDPQLSGK